MKSPLNVGHLCLLGLLLLIGGIAADKEIGIHYACVGAAMIVVATCPFLKR